METTKLLAYIAHPYRASDKKGIYQNFKIAQMYGKKAWKEGLIPVIPHFNSCAVFGLTKGKNEDITIYDLHLLSKCDILWACGDRISGGMKIEIEFCKERVIPV